MEVHAEGIYFGMTDEEYHADPSLGSTNVKQLKVSASDYYWASRLNPLQDEIPEVEKRAYIYGRATHKILLEGTEAFEEAYTHLPHKGDIKGLLDTNDDLLGWLRARAVYVPSKAKKADMIDLVQKTSAGNGEAPPPIWELIRAEHEKSGKIILTFNEYKRLMLAASLVTAHPMMAPCFTQGYPEVAVFWRKNIDGVMVPCKAKKDYLKLIATTDLKSMGNSAGRDLKATAVRAIATYGYDLQFAHYQEARMVARRLVDEGKVFDLTGGKRIKELVPENPNAGTMKVIDRPAFPPRKWLAAFAKQTEWRWFWIMTKKEGMPLSIPIEFAANAQASAANAEREMALARYALFMRKFGPTRLWVDSEDILQLTETDLPAWTRS